MKTKESLHFRFAHEHDVDLYFKWMNDKLVRENSFNQKLLIYDDHVQWFQSKLASRDCFFYLFLNHKDQPVGQVRIDNNHQEIIIGISIDENYRGKGLGAAMIEMASGDYLQKFPLAVIVAYIKVENRASYHIFKKAGFNHEEIVTVQDCESYKLYKKSISQ